MHYFFVLCNMKKLYFFIVSISLVLSACKKDSTASWLKIDSVNLTTNLVVEGENSHAINYVWIYMDNQSLGIFEVPCEIPILAEGEHDFIFFAGIKKDGIFDQGHSIYRYPFYDKIDEKLTLVKEQTLNYTPNFKYKNGVSFVGKEDFEDTGIILQNDPNEDTTQIHIISKANYPNIIKYGNNCGRLIVSNIDTIAQVFTDIGLSLPKGEIFMEIDYMNDNTFAQGSITNVEILDPYLLMAAQDKATMKWKKMYIDIGAQTNYLSYTPSSYNYYFTANIDDGNSVGTIYIDNIKILYFE